MTTSFNVSRLYAALAREKSFLKFQTKIAGKKKEKETRKNLQGNSEYGRGRENK